LDGVDERIARKLDGASGPQLNGLPFAGILREGKQGGLDG
jgi:hypothetical protein